MCKSMVFGVKSAAAVGDKDTVINIIINISLTFPFVHMTWLDSDGKYHILCCYKYHIYYVCVHIRDNHHV